MYKIVADTVTGKGNKTFFKNEIVAENMLLNVSELLENGSIIDVQEKQKPKKAE